MIATKKWITFVMGMFVMAISGTVYLYPLYSDQIKLSLNLTTEQTNSIGSWISVGTWFGIIGGLFYDRYGPRMTCIIASVLIFAGYFGLARVVESHSQNHDKISINLLAFLAFLAGQGSQWTYTSALNTNCANFSSKDRGKAVGILVSYFGLCSGIFTLIYKSFFQAHPVDDFLTFVSITACSFALFGCVLLRFVSQNQELTPEIMADRTKDSSRFSLPLIWVSLIALFIGFITLAQKSLLFSCNEVCRERVQRIGAYVLLAFVAVNLVWPIRIFYNDFVEKRQALEGKSMDPVSNYDYVEPKQKNQKDRPFIGLLEETDVEHEDNIEPQSDGPLEGDLSPLEAIKRPNFLLLFYCIFATVGCGIMVLQNIAEIVISLEDVQSGATYVTKNLPHNEDISMLVALFSVCNTLGRLIMGYLSDLTVSRMHTVFKIDSSISRTNLWLSKLNFNRATWLIVCSFIMASMHFLLIFGKIKILPLVISLLALSYGGTWCIIPTLTSELFGLKNFGAIFGIIGLGPALGSEFLATLLAGKLNDHYAKKQWIDTVDNEGDIDDVASRARHCLGHDCYRVTFMITTVIAFSSCLCAFILHRQYARLQSK